MQKIESVPIEFENPAPEIAAPVDAAELSGNLPFTMPTPTAAESAPGAPNAESAPVPVDRRGIRFDPAAHRADAAGNPLRNKHGNFYAKNLGAPKKSSAAKISPPVNRPAPRFVDLENISAPAPSAEASGAVEFAPADNYDACAEAWLVGCYVAVTALLGPDAKPDDDEHAALKAPLTAVLRRGKVRELDPRLTLAVVAAGIFMRKLEKPTVRDKWDRLKLVSGQWWARLTKKEIKP